MTGVNPGCRIGWVTPKNGGARLRLRCTETNIGPDAS